MRLSIAADRKRKNPQAMIATIAPSRAKCSVTQNRIKNAPASNRLLRREIIFSFCCGPTIDYTAAGLFIASKVLPTRFKIKEQN
jgi:hypothetical protein